MSADCFHALGHICKFALGCKNLYRIGPWLSGLLPQAWVPLLFLKVWANTNRQSEVCKSQSLANPWGDGVQSKFVWYYIGICLDQCITWSVDLRSKSKSFIRFVWWSTVQKGCTFKSNKLLKPVYEKVFLKFLLSPKIFNWLQNMHLY